MRHGNKNNALGRKKAHRGALMSNMAISLIEHKRIETTLAKAKALRRYVEPLITKSKEDSTHSRRVVFSELQNKDATAALFRALADPNRVRIVHLLATSPGPVCVCDLTEPLGIGQPTVSHHLRKLLDAGLVRREARGTWAYYSLDGDALDRLVRVADLTGTTGAAGIAPAADTTEETEET